MSGPDTGEYLIQLVADPRPPIGVDDGSAPLVPVVTDGNNNIWTVKKLEDGKYTLVLEEHFRPWFIQVDNEQLVGSKDQPPFHWTIEGPDGGPYAIKVVGILPDRAWTVNNPGPKQPVTLNFIEYPLGPRQQFKFIPRHGAK